mmetsp:Transcript_1039/g.2407  ORF Transcript_1039/g.2407 Transcript_1039/m.2407 type:complete len:149 (+) Transcript_1039:1597-2043(+)
MSAKLSPTASVAIFTVEAAESLWFSNEKSRSSSESKRPKRVACGIVHAFGARDCDSCVSLSSLTLFGFDLVFDVTLKWDLSSQASPLLCFDRVERSDSDREKTSRLLLILMNDPNTCLLSSSNRRVAFWIAIDENVTKKLILGRYEFS